MINKVVFFNHFHNGDLHCSRGLVNYTIEKIISIYKNVEFIYTHKNDPFVLNDIEAKFDSKLIYNLNCKDNHFIKNNILFINTWYGANNLKYLKEYGISFDCLFYSFNDLFKNILKISDIDEDPKKLFPKINFNKFNINKIDIDKLKLKKVLIVNDDVKSGQSFNFDFKPCIEYLSNKNPNICFILTKKIDLIKENVLFSSDIINSEKCDLNENAYIGSFCDVIIGRSSGSFTFCYNYDILFNKNIKMISFIVSKYEHAFDISWLGKSFSNKINYKSNVLQFYDIKDGLTASKIIEKFL